MIQENNHARVVRRLEFVRHVWSVTQGHTSQHYLYEVHVDLGLPSHTVGEGLLTVSGVDLQLIQEVMTASTWRGIIPCAPEKVRLPVLTIITT